MQHHHAELRTSLDDALAPDDEPVAFVTEQTVCTVVGCGQSAVTFVPVGDGSTVVTPRCVEHGPDRWRLTDDSQANWALHKLAAARRDLADVDTLYRAELDRLNAWRQAQQREAQARALFFERHLVAYVMTLRAQDPEGRERTKHALPGGTVKFTRSQSVQVEDEDALVGWARGQHDDVLTVAVSVGRLRDLLQKDAERQLLPVTEDGEKVPGIRIERRLTPRVET